MSYFFDYADHFKYKVAERPNQGLRPGQVGALHAVASHFLAKTEPAIVSLPTGYGKTAVMQGLCFVAASKRVLVVVPTDALRKQTSKAFKSLDTLRRLGALPSHDQVPSPVVVAVEGRLGTEQAWIDAVGPADVIIVTPVTASPGMEGVAAPPHGLFDLVIVDEGHHSPARTWKALIEHTPDAQHVLLSATPFRRDKLQLPGKVVFFYPLQRAVQEEAFGKVKFVPVDLEVEASREAIDEALIAMAIEVFRKDKAAGFDHRALIRTDKIRSAEDLEKKYLRAGLKVKAVSSRLGKPSITRIENDLESGELDGIVCVDMFGEGYDFPKFKIAVLHVAHRSLVPTLQFIGRFARTNDESTGEASFIAFPENINAESAELYQSGVDWSLLLANIADAQQVLSIQDKETLDSFDEIAKSSIDYEAINPGNLRLPRHLAGFWVENAPDFNRVEGNVRSLIVTNAWISDDQNTVVIMMNENTSTPWVFGSEVMDSQHECALIRFYPESSFVFVTSTRKAAYLYRELLEQFFEGAIRPLDYAKARGVLNGLNGQEFFSVGIRNNSPMPAAESYRIVAGAQADRGIRDADAGNYVQGHFFGRGEINGNKEIIGASGGGRIWSNGKCSIPNLIKWMDELYARIVSDKQTIGPSGLDRLPFGEPLTEIPCDTFAADWSPNTYRTPPSFRWSNAQRTQSSLLDLEIQSVKANGDQQNVEFVITDDQNTAHLKFTLSEYPHWHQISELTVEVEQHGRWVCIEEWLADHPLTFFTTGFSSFVGNMLTKRGKGAALNHEAIRTMSWEGCERSIEFDLDDPDRRTVQKFLQDRLQEGNPDFLIFDHRSGEAADFIQGQFLPDDGVKITLYHCKGSTGEPLSARRVDDVYELAGQSVKSVRFMRKEQLIGHVQRRTKQVAGKGYSPFLVGDRDAVLERLRATQPIGINIEVIAVQPGISAEKLWEDDHEKAQNVRELMAATNDSVVTQQGKQVWLISP
ncbi:MAG: DEAD/DEAH box helicase family protein [Marinobacter sp.]|nr:DEAD/DEAH box helicase family protein [Marinobacter sp.]